MCWSGAAAVDMLQAASCMPLQQADITGAAGASVRVHVQAAAVLVGGSLTLRASALVVLVDASGPW